MNWNKWRKVFPTTCKIAQALIPVNRKRQIISSILFVLLLGPNAQGQTGDWQAVQNLRPGTRISVKAQHHIVCIFQAASDDELVCKPLRLLRLGPAESRFDRQSISEVRLEHSQAKDMWIGAGIGTGAGAVAGASSGSGSRGFNVSVGALSGALVGTVAGGIVSVFRRDKLIYKR